MKSYERVSETVTADEIIEKIKARINSMPVEEHAHALMELFKARESRLRARILTREKQIHLLKTSPETWNKWWDFVFSGPLTVTGIENLSPFLIYEYTVEELIRLRDVDFSGCDLSPVKFQWGVDLSGCCFENANLEGADFDKCVLNGVTFKNANLRHARLHHCIFSDVNFDGADLRFAHGTSQFFRTVSFTGAMIKSTCLVIDYHGTPSSIDVENHVVRGRLIQENGTVKFIADPDAEKNVEDWRGW